MSAGPADPRFAFLCSIEAEVGEIQTLGQAPTGERRVVGITGGRVTGPGIVGTIEPGGADWQILRSDGVLEIAAHYVLRLDDGALIEVRSDGYRFGPAEIMARLARGEPIPSESYYFRTTIRFQTGAASRSELNRVIGVAVARREPRLVRLDVHRLL